MTTERKEMPRTNLCRPAEDIAYEKMIKLLLGSIQTGRVKKNKLAEAIGKSPSSISKMIKRKSLRIKDFLIIIHELDLSDEEILEMITY